MLLCGIDPGLSGHIVFLSEEGELLSKTPMPIKTVKGQRHLNEEEIFKLFKTKEGTFTVCIEKQYAMRGQGLSSTAKTVGNYKWILGLLRGLEVPTITVTAREWQKAILGKCADTKEASIAEARKAYPTLDLLRTPRCKKPDHGIADAVGIARYGLIRRKKDK